jgi:Restriction endonuclease AspBHI N-terminal
MRRDAAVRSDQRDRCPSWRAGHRGDDPIDRLTGTGNAGGFRIRNSSARNHQAYGVLFSSGADPDWPDILDEATSTFTYHGDQRFQDAICMTLHVAATGSSKGCGSSPHKVRRVEPGFRLCFYLSRLIQALTSSTEAYSLPEAQSFPSTSSLSRSGALAKDSAIRTTAQRSLCSTHRASNVGGWTT